LLATEEALEALLEASPDPEAADLLAREEALEALLLASEEALEALAPREPVAL